MIFYFRKCFNITNIKNKIRSSSSFFYRPVKFMDVVPEGFVHFSDVQEMLRIFHDVWSRLEHSCCREALAMDPSRFRNRDRTQKLGGRKFLTVDFIVC